MQSRSDTGGYEPRFIVERTDGKPIQADRRYMVMSFDGSDPEAVEAILHYASLKEGKNSRLAADIRALIANPEDAPAQHRYA